MEGNLPVSSKCLVCEKTCGSVLRYSYYNIIFTQEIYREITVDILFTGFKTCGVYGAEQPYTQCANLPQVSNVH